MAISILINYTQVKQFLNIVYSSYILKNNEVHEYKGITMKGILSMIWKYCDLLDEKLMRPLENSAQIIKLNL